jgi:hypothetical protein
LSRNTIISGTLRSRSNMTRKLSSAVYCCTACLLATFDTGQQQAEPHSCSVLLYSVPAGDVRYRATASRTTQLHCTAVQRACWRRSILGNSKLNHCTTQLQLANLLSLPGTIMCNVRVKNKNYVLFFCEK